MTRIIAKLLAVTIVLPAFIQVAPLEAVQEHQKNKHWPRGLTDLVRPLLT